MADLNIGPVRPSTAFQEPTSVPVDAPPLPENFGPDFTQTPEKEEPRIPKINLRHPPKPATTKKSTTDTSFKLGQNKKTRSPVRRLTREAPTGESKSDFERLVDWYLRISRMTVMFHPKFSAAMEQQAEDCAESWFDLAENNDTVRRYILGFIEGGAWGKVIAAHTPIFLAVIPEEVLVRFFLKGMGMFNKNISEQMAEGMFANAAA